MMQPTLRLFSMMMMMLIGGARADPPPMGDSSILDVMFSDPIEPCPGLTDMLCILGTDTVVIAQNGTVSAEYDVTYTASTMKLTITYPSMPSMPGLLMEASMTIDYDSLTMTYEAINPALVQPFTIVSNMEVGPVFNESVRDTLDIITSSDRRLTSDPASVAIANNLGAVDTPEARRRLRGSYCQTVCVDVLIIEITAIVIQWYVRWTDCILIKRKPDYFVSCDIPASRNVSIVAPH